MWQSAEKSRNLAILLQGRFKRPPEFAPETDVTKILQLAVKLKEVVITVFERLFTLM